MLESKNCCIPACKVEDIWHYFPDVSKKVKLGLFSREPIRSLLVNISESVGVTVNCDHHFNVRIQTTAKWEIIMIQML